MDRFGDKGLDMTALESKKWTALEGDLAKEDLVLSEAVYKAVCFTITASQFLHFDFSY
jgi:hypothetical protein